MRRAFLEYLVSQGVVPSNRLEILQRVLRGVPEPIGSIAFRYGMITGADIDVILDEQRGEHRPFGQIAVERSLLTQEQVDTLLLVQQMRAATETAEALALSGICSIEQIIPLLGSFLAQSAGALCGSS